MYLFYIKGMIIMKKILFAFLFLTIITITATACGDKSGKSITQADRTPVTSETTVITSVATTTSKTTSPAPNIEPEYTTPTPLPATTVPVETSPAKTAPAQTTPVETSPVKTSPAQTTDPIFENLYGALKEYTEQQEFTDEITPAEELDPAVNQFQRHIKLTEFKFEIKPNGNLILVEFKPEDPYVTAFSIPKKYDGRTVDEIAPGVFCNFDFLVSVSCPDTITKIGDGAFSECDNLESVHINAPECELGDYLFDNSPLVTVYVHKNSVAQQDAIENGYNYNVI
jgi:hypothetical protein